MDKNNDKDYNELIKKSILFSKQNNLSSAKNFLEKAISLNPSKSLSYINLSNIYLLEKNLKLSLKILNNYLEKYNFNLDVVNHLGKICINFDLFDELISLKKNLFKNKNINNNFYYIYFLFGIAHEKKEEFFDAIESYKISIKYNKTFTENYLNLCNLYEKTNKINELEKTIKKAKVNCIPDPRIDYFFSLLNHREKKYSISQSLIENTKLEEKLISHNLYYSNLLDLKFKNFEKLNFFKKAF